MVARYYEASLGRFLSVDPSRRSTAPLNPQSWNRYAYARNNPVGFVDPDGEAARVFIDNQTTGQTKASFSVDKVAASVQNKFDKAGADTIVKVGKPGFLDKVVAGLKGDSIHTVALVNQGAAGEPPAARADVGHQGGGLPTEVHVDNAAKDNSSTPQNERETAVANSTTHEAGHDIGLAGDNQNKPPDVMTGPVPPGTLTKPLEFNAPDAAKLQKLTK